MTIRRHAARLGLQFPRLEVLMGPRTTQLPLPKKTQEVVNKSIETYRKEWLAILQNHPGARRSFLSRKYSRIHGCVTNHDAEWLEANSPPPHVKVKLSASPNWEKQDADLANSIRASAYYLKNQSERPQRVTKRAINLLLKKSSLLMYHLDELPVSKETLIEVVETSEEFVIRKLISITNRCQEQDILRLRQLILRIRYNPHLAASTAVQDAINAALKALNLLNSNN